MLLLAHLNVQQSCEGLLLESHSRAMTCQAVNIFTVNLKKLEWDNETVEKHYLFGN